MKSAALLVFVLAPLIHGSDALPLPIGARAPRFSLTARNGETVDSSTLLGAKATVVAFIGTKCPVSAAYNQRMIAAYREYTGRGVAFLFVNSNSNETVAEMKTYESKAALPFQIYKDWRNAAADQLGADNTPEFLVLDKDGVLRYRGAFDDAQNEARIRVHGLRDALDSVLAGKPVEHETLKAFGCVLHRARPEATH